MKLRGHKTGIPAKQSRNEVKNPSRYTSHQEELQLIKDESKGIKLIF